MKHFGKPSCADSLATLERKTFADMAVGDYFITRTYEPRHGAIYMKMQKTGGFSAIMLESFR